MMTSLLWSTHLRKNPRGACGKFARKATRMIRNLFYAVLNGFTEQFMQLLDARLLHTNRHVGNAKLAKLG